MLCSRVWDLCLRGSFLVWHLLRKHSVIQFSVEDQSKCQAGWFCSPLSTPGTGTARAEDFLRNVSVCVRSECNSSAVSHTFHLVFESVQSLTFSALPLAPACWDNAHETSISLPSLESPWQAEFLTSFTMSNFSLVDLFNFSKIIFFSPNNDLEFVHQLEAPGTAFLPRHWQEGGSVLYHAGQLCHS